MPKELRFGKGRHRRVANLAGRRRSCASRFVEGDVRGRRRRSGRGRERRGCAASNSRCAAGRDLARRQHARHDRVGALRRAEGRARDQGRSDRLAHRRGPRRRRRRRRRPARMRSCESRSARSSCSPLQSVSQGACSASPSVRRRSGHTSPGRSSCSTRAISGTCSKSSAVSASCFRARTCRPSRPSRAHSSRRTPARVLIPSVSRAMRARLPAQSAGKRCAKDQSTPYGFLLHDVGKIGIPDGILQKPAR